MSKHYVYVETGYECHNDRFLRQSDRNKFIEKCIKYVSEGKVAHVDDKIRRSCLSDIKEIIKHFGNHDGSDNHDSPERHDSSDNYYYDRIQRERDNAGEEIPSEMDNKPYFIGNFIGERIEGSEKFPSRYGNTYDSSNPLFILAGDTDVSDVLTLTRLLKMSQDIGWCNIWKDKDQLKDARKSLKTYIINDNIKFSYVWFDAENG